MYGKSSFGHRESFGGHRYCTGTTERVLGSIGWGHLCRRAPWAEVGGETAPSGLVRPPLAPPAPRVGNPRGGGASTYLGGPSTPLAAAP